MFARMALVSTFFFQMFIVLGMYNFGYDEPGRYEWWIWMTALYAEKISEIGRLDNPKTFFSYFLGRVINNVFVPANAVVPEAVSVRQPKGQ